MVMTTSEFARTPEEAATNERERIAQISAEHTGLGGLPGLMERIASRRVVAIRQRDEDTPRIDDPGDRAEAVARLNAIIEEDEKALARLVTMIPGA